MSREDRRGDSWSANKNNGNAGKNGQPDNRTYSPGDNRTYNPSDNRGHNPGDSRTNRAGRRDETRGESRDELRIRLGGRIDRPDTRTDRRDDRFDRRDDRFDRRDARYDRRDDYRYDAGDFRRRDVPVITIWFRNRGLMHAPAYGRRDRYNFRPGIFLSAMILSRLDGLPFDLELELGPLPWYLERRIYGRTVLVIDTRTRLVVDMYDIDW